MKRNEEEEPTKEGRSPLEREEMFWNIPFCLKVNLVSCIDDCSVPTGRAGHSTVVE